MSDLTPTALAVLGRQHGVASSRQLADAGVGRTTKHRLLRRGVLEESAKGVYRLASHAASLEQRCATLCLAHATGFITGPTAGMLVGLRRMPGMSPLHLAVRHGARVDRLDGVRLRQTTRIDIIDVDRSRADGIRVASWSRLAFDLAADLSARDHRSVVEQLLHDGRCTVEQLTATASRLAHPARPGSIRFVETLTRRTGPALESHPELVVAEGLRARGVPVEAQTTWLELPGGGRARIDLSVRELRWGVEVDVHPEHLGLEGTTSDKRRDRRCHLLGWEIERLTALDLEQLDPVLDELALLYHLRRRERAS
jgi:hypothetical protein